jgi:hypothetical protein
MICYKKSSYIIFYAVGIWMLSNLIHAVTAEEYSILRDSTVIGRNFGYPSGTPRSGHTPVGEFDVVIETAIFFKNLELSGFDDQTGIDGETFFGFLLPLRARYRAHEKVTFEMGAVLGKDFGDEDELNVAEPLVRLVGEPIQDLFLVAGTILQTHWIHDAILDDVIKYRINAEQGLQTRLNFKRWKQDTWINWRVRENSFDSEEFEVGTSTQLRLLEQAFWLNGEGMWAHVGGQKNQANRNEHNFAFLGGASYGFARPFGIEFMDELRIGANYLYSIDERRNKHTQYGNGYEFFAKMDTKPHSNIFLRLHGSYFDGDDFLASRGDPLYGLDKYGQLGAVAIYSLPAGLRIETGIVGQYNDENGDELLNYTYQINFTWGEAFAMSFLKPRINHYRP